MPPSRLDRYHSVIEDWDSFQAAIDAPLPHTLRVNTLRTSRADLVDRLSRAGIEHRTMPWTDELLEMSGAPGRTIEHWLGLFYVQEAVQLLPVMALNPQPGDTALDLCAAPGGKSTFMAARMRNRGHLVANEPNGRRQMALLANVNRLGVLNCTITSYHGENFPMSTRFDRILVDAPCSAEGTLRKTPSLREGATESAIVRLTHLQKRLLLRAFDLLAPDGHLVYSTCTFAPEENEAVVTYLLQERAATIEPVALPVPSSPGLDGWNDQPFPATVRHCARIYPHHLNSGGGFLARIVRV